MSVLHMTYNAKFLSTARNLFIKFHIGMYYARTTDTQWRHKSKISEKLGRCGRQNMLRPYLKIWEWEWIFGRAVKATSSLGVRSPWVGSNKAKFQNFKLMDIYFFFIYFRRKQLTWLQKLGLASKIWCKHTCQIPTQLFYAFKVI